MAKIREIVVTKTILRFFDKATIKVRTKFQVLEAIETLERIPTNNLIYIVGTMDFTRLGFSWRQIFGGFSASLTMDCRILKMGFKKEQKKKK
jgi:hypothetical protein